MKNTNNNLSALDITVKSSIMEKETEIPIASGRGGFRKGAGRKKRPGTRHTLIVPEDVENVLSARGIDYIWESVRFKVRFDNMQINQ